MTQLETMQRAKIYMDKLAQGIDPLTDQELPEDSALNQVRLARCFFYVSSVLGQVIANGGVIGQKPKKQLFYLTPEQFAKIRLPGHPVRISEFTQMLHTAADNPEIKKPSTTSITDWLLDKGFLIKETGPDGKPRRVPTDAGRALGIYTELRQGQYGEYLAVFYSPEAQQFLLDNLDAIFRENSAAN